jgi:hypothetical protein
MSVGLIARQEGNTEKCAGWENEISRKIEKSTIPETSMTPV